ncbi:MAG: twin-arginine translocase TatA/TatE family subunit [Candidatus Hodarchaeota archaeon]
MAGLGALELLVLIIFALILFGPKKLPELARSIGNAQAEYEAARRARLSQRKMERQTQSRKLNSPTTSPSTNVSDELSDEELLIEAAEKMGIETEGKKIEEIAQEVLKKVEKEKESTKN